MFERLNQQTCAVSDSLISTTQLYLSTLFICVQNRRALYICRIDVCINAAPDLPWNKQYHDHCSFVSECTMWCISAVPPENPGVRTRRIISVSAHRTLQHPLHLYLSIFSGRNCAALTQIYFNTQHNIWTNKTKRRRAFYILLSRSKKIKIKIWSGNIGEFFMDLPILHSDV